MSSKDIQKWLDSPDGQKWSESRHADRIAGRQPSGMGVFGETKSDTDACDWHGRCTFAGRDGKGGCR